MYCLEHGCFVLNCSFACHPAELAPCIHPACFPCFAVKSSSCGRNWSTHVLLCLCWTQQMLCGELQQMDLLSSDDTCSLTDHFIACACSVCTLIDTLIKRLSMQFSSSLQKDERYHEKKITKKKMRTNALISVRPWDIFACWCIPFVYSNPKWRMVCILLKIKNTVCFIFYSNMFSWYDLQS